VKKIAAMAEAYNAEVAPHLYAGPVEWAANVHLATTLPNLSMVETIGTGGGFHAELICGSIRWEDGFILPPEGPGLGIEVNEALLFTHAYDGDRLHLEMQEAPCDWRHGNAFRGGAAD
jgi:L-alanine-DL-glutamate epimerase-like enolase superfamily enzyme